jgi:hypothetical protein
MQRLCLVVFMMVGALAFAQDESAFFSKMAGKTIVGKTKEGKTETFVFSPDGKTVVVKRGSWKHIFVKMVGDIAIYEGLTKYPNGRTHYDGFMIKDDQTVMVMGPSAYGDIEDNIDKVDSIDVIVAGMPSFGLPYSIKAKK